jgi:hypothetical protein
MTAGLTIAERRDLFMAGAFRWRQWWIEPRPPGSRRCVCGERATEKIGGDYVCPKCQRLDSVNAANGRQLHPWDFQGDGLAKVNTSLDNGQDDWQSEGA